MDEILQLILRSYGLLGVLLLAPLFASWVVWKDNKILRKELADSQQRRVQDAQEISRGLLASATEDSALKKETNLLLERMGETLDRLERS